MITRPITRPITSPIARAVNNPFGIWNPRALFALGEQGFWYDPSDLSTLFQDAAGTTPVTAAGQPVGLMLDKSGNGNHASIATAASRPILRQNATTGAYYLETDGVDDWMQTNAINFTVTDKISLFAGVRKLSDATRGMLIEMGAGSPIGSFAVQAPPSNGAAQFGASSTGTIAISATTASVYAAPVSAVIGMIADISAPKIEVSVNGVIAASNAASQGSGSYGTHILYLFRRAGTTLPFNGHCYGLIGVGRLTTAAEIANIGRMLAQRTGVVLT